MTDISLFPRGLLIGLSVAAPVGAMSLLCIRRTIESGRKLGFVSGVGVASADALFGAVAAFGLTSISSFLIDQQNWVRLIGGSFLIYLGFTTVRMVAADDRVDPSPPTGSDYLGAYLSMVGLTLTNPTTILSFVAIFAGYGVAGATTNAASAAALVAGVFVGSCAWWLCLTTVTDRLRGRLTPRVLTLVNRVTGVALCAFGVIAIVSAIT